VADPRAERDDRIDDEVARYDVELGVTRIADDRHHREARLAQERLDGVVRAVLLLRRAGRAVAHHGRGPGDRRRQPRAHRALHLDFGAALRLLVRVVERLPDVEVRLAEGR